MGKPKIPPVRVPSDDCLVHVGRVIADGKVIDEGQAYAVHEGEWVELLPVASIGEYLALSRIGRMDRSGGTSPEDESAFERLCQALAQRVLDWNWTDMTGEPLPCPYRRPEVIQGLSGEEVVWLQQAAIGENAGAAKNASAPLGDSSSPKATKRGPSRGKR